jgi:myo-inositol 2-dehydrogenase/D-chiro-inositol 1-dehydrogenase
VTVRVGVVGAGNIGTAHAVNLARVVSGSQVTVVADADAGRAAGLAAEVGARSVPSLPDVLAADDVDAVLLASPDDIHAEQALLGIAAGRPMLCEKPLATTEPGAAAVLDAEVALGRRLVQLGFMRRFDPGYAQLKAELTAEGVGDPLVVHNIHRNTAAPYGLVTERVLTNMVVHELDICRWLLDEEYASVTVVTGRTGPLTPEGQHDPVLLLLRSQRGVVVEVEAFANAQYGYEVACRVTGSHGQAAMGDGSFVTRSASFRRGVALPELWTGRFAEAYRRQLQGWVDALRTGSPPPGATAWDGYAATVVATRAVEAYRTGGWVDIVLPPRPALYGG